MSSNHNIIIVEAIQSNSRTNRRASAYGDRNHDKFTSRGRRGDFNLVLRLDLNRNFMISQNQIVAQNQFRLYTLSL